MSSKNKNHIDILGGYRKRKEELDDCISKFVSEQIEIFLKETHIPITDLKVESCRYTSPVGNSRPPFVDLDYSKIRVEIQISCGIGERYIDWY
jgi:hypothetical protein